ncbi:hypothetical protein D9M69_537510 [compost metagenome]
MAGEGALPLATGELQIEQPVALTPGQGLGLLIGEQHLHPTAGMHGGRQAEQLGSGLGIQHQQGGSDPGQIHRQVVAQLATLGQQAGGRQRVDVQVSGVHHLRQVRQLPRGLTVEGGHPLDAAHPHRPIGGQVMVDSEAHRRGAGDGRDRPVRQQRLHDAQDLAERGAPDNGQV